MQIKYYTVHEKKFLDKIGAYAKPLRTSPQESMEERKIRLLKNYKESIRKRVFWRNISRHDIAIYVNVLIRGLVLQPLQGDTYEEKKPLEMG